MVEVKVRSGDDELLIRKRKEPELGSWIQIRGRWWHVIAASWLV